MRKTNGETLKYGFCFSWLSEEYIYIYIYTCIYIYIFNIYISYIIYTYIEDIQNKPIFKIFRQ